ncbi:MAG: PIG-L family deacetylase [Gordonia sp. (in: high G+C Gram-positive bacteria)]
MLVPRLMFVHAHPDDESLWTGGAIARHVARGGELEVVMATWAPGTRRHTELCRALGELGVTAEPVTLGYADDGVPESAPGRPKLCEAVFSHEVRELVSHIRRFRPHAIVTYDPFGVYGHRDHIHTHRLACAAADAAALPTLYRRHGAPWRVRSLYFATVPEKMIDEVSDDLFPGVPRADLPGTPPDLVDVEMDVSAFVDRKQAAIAAHRTEVVRSQTISMLMALPQDKLDHLLGSECYMRRDLVPGGCEL